MAQPPATTPAGSEPTGTAPWERPGGHEVAGDPYASNPYASYAETDDASTSSDASSSDYGYGDSDSDSGSDPVASPEATGADGPSGSVAADPYSAPADPSGPDPDPYAAPQAYVPQQQPYAPQQAYDGQSGYGYAPAAPQSGISLASMITGISALVLGGMCAVPILAAPVAIILAVMGMRETGPGQKGGRGFAIAGLVSGIIGTILIVGVVLLYGGMIIAMLATATQS